MRVQRRVGRWTVEAFTDFQCLLVGINWLTFPVVAVYIHLGPVTLGVYQWRDPA